MQPDTGPRPGMTARSPSGRAGARSVRAARDGPEHRRCRRCGAGAPQPGGSGRHGRRPRSGRAVPRGSGGTRRFVDRAGPEPACGDDSPRCRPTPTARLGGVGRSPDPSGRTRASGGSASWPGPRRAPPGGRTRPMRPDRGRPRRPSHPLGAWASAPAHHRGDRGSNAPTDPEQDQRLRPSGARMRSRSSAVSVGFVPTERPASGSMSGSAMSARSNPGRRRLAWRR
jgi:hypothetical protein